MYSLSWFRRPDLTRLAALGFASVLLSACSMPMGSLLGGDDKPDVTSSTSVSTETGRATAAGHTPGGTVQLASTGSATAPDGTPLSPTDWNYARGALGLALTSTETGPPVPWANPETGARGNFAPVAAAVTADGGKTCRDFVATRTENGKEVQLQGRACLTPDGQWDIAETSKTAL
jgi:surface antigen